MSTLKKNTFIWLAPFFQVIHLLLIKNWLHTQQFHDVDDLAAAYGSNEIGNNLLKDPTNAVYVSPEYLGNHIKTIYKYIRLPLLES